MMAGHSLLAFALAATGAAVLSDDRRWALVVGVVAAAFAAVPDVDMLYALVGVARAGVAPVDAVHDAFWASGLSVHRAVTHSLVLGVPAAVAFALAGVAADRRGVAGGRDRDRRRAAGAAAALAFLAGLVAAALGASGVLAASIVALYAAGGVAVAAVAVRRGGVAPRTVLGAALVGLLSHPFGDVFTGQPPEFLYPLLSVSVERVTLVADPTLNLLAVFGLEVAAAWLAATVYFRLSGRSLAAHVDRRAVVAGAYAVAAVTMPPPTMEVSYHFVFSVLAVGAVTAVPLGSAPRLALAGERLRAPGRVADAAKRRVRAWRRSLRAWRRSLAVARRRVATRAARTPATGATATVDRSLPDLHRTVATGLAAVTMAALAYAVAYLLGTPTFL